MPHRPIITLTTDFGLNDHVVGTVKGVILNIVPDADVVDISHSIDPFDVLDGALTFAQAYPYFPAETVHLVVVDPGVGTVRRPIVVATKKYRFVGPDNGVLSLVRGHEERVRIHHVTAEHYYLKPVSQTFHARDIFAPIAASLAKGVLPEKLGDEVSDWVEIEIPQPKPVDDRTLRGTVLKVDRFGNLITNIQPSHAPALFQPQPPGFKILVGNREVTKVHATYAAGATGEVFGILGSMGYLEIAANCGSASAIVGAGKGSSVDIVL